MLLWLLVLLVLQTRAAVEEALAEYEKRLAQPGLWTEVTPPHLEMKSVRFPRPGVAVVEAVQSQYGSLIVKRSVAVTIVLRRFGSRWHVQFYRATSSGIMMP